VEHILWELLQGFVTGMVAIGVYRLIMKWQELR